jgi:hypothetical protein
MRPGLLAFIVWIAVWLIVMVVFLVTQLVFYRESRRTHGLWRSLLEQTYGTNMAGVPRDGVSDVSEA